MATIVKAREQIPRWLRREAGYQEDKFTQHGVAGADLVSFLVETEIPQKWQANADLWWNGRAADIRLANQLLLKLVAAARAAVEHTAEAGAADDISPTLRSFVMSSTVLEQTKEDKLPYPTWLREPKPELIFEDTRPDYLLERTTQLAVCGLLLESQALGDFKLPYPGVPTGQVEPWDPVIV